MGYGFKTLVAGSTVMTHWYGMVPGAAVRYFEVLRCVNISLSQSCEKHRVLLLRRIAEGTNSICLYAHGLLVHG